MLPVVIAAYHCGYGIGGLLGWFDVLTRRHVGAQALCAPHSLTPWQHHSADETDAVRARYERRKPCEWRYSRLNPAALLAAQERERAITRLFGRLGWSDLTGRRVLEVGCGSGGNLLELLQMGFAPRNLVGHRAVGGSVRSGACSACRPA